MAEAEKRFDVAAQAVFRTIGKVLEDANRFYAAGNLEEALFMTRAWGQGRVAQRLVEGMAEERGQALPYQDQWAGHK